MDPIQAISQLITWSFKITGTIVRGSFRTITWGASSASARASATPVDTTAEHLARQRFEAHARAFAADRARGDSQRGW